MRADLLHVVAVYANPIRWASRIRLHNEFEQHMLECGVKLTTVECAYGDRPWELPDDDRINRVRVRSKSIVWNKENLINIGISRLPHDWEYVAWVDADILFRDRNWARETVHALQQYDIIQPWSDAYDLGPKGEHIAAYRSWGRQFWTDKPVSKRADRWWTWEGGDYDFAHPGYAWAATRRAIDLLGGLIEIGACGAGDHHMASSLAGEGRYSMPGTISSAYSRIVMEWERRAISHICGNIGFLWGTIEHFFHGSKNNRGYVDRWQILLGNGFNPDIDLKRNSYGVVELAGNKPKLRHQLDVYMRSRLEDGNLI